MLEYYGFTPKSTNHLYDDWPCMTYFQIYLYDGPYQHQLELSFNLKGHGHVAKKHNYEVPSQIRPNHQPANIGETSFPNHIGMQMGYFFLDKTLPRNEDPPCAIQFCQEIKSAVGRYLSSYGVMHLHTTAPAISKCTCTPSHHLAAMWIISSLLVTHHCNCVSGYFWCHWCECSHEVWYTF